MIEQWILDKIEAHRRVPLIILRDPQRMIQPGAHVVDGWAEEHGFSVLFCAGNLALREMYERAVEYAQRGRYEVAVRMLRDVLEDLPGDTDARRNLAMSYMEIRNSGDARRHIVEVLRLDPKDAWAFLILGNLYGRSERDLESAERFYQKAYELDPDDAYLLSSYGAAKAKSGRLDCVVIDASIASCDNLWYHYSLGRV